MIIAEQGVAGNGEAPVLWPPSKPVTLNWLIAVEPELLDVLAEARRTRRRRRPSWGDYEHGKRRLQRLVGWGARCERLGTAQAFDIAVAALRDALGL